jgi:hypothetical protein
MATIGHFLFYQIVAPLGLVSIQLIDLALQTVAPMELVSIQLIDLK